MLAGALGVAAAAILPRAASATAASGAHNGLENNASQWNTYVDPGGLPDGSIIFGPPTNVKSPAHSGKALQLAIDGGNRPYTHLQGYRDLAYVDAAAFELSFHWRFSDTTLNNQGGRSNVQAIELATNKWSDTNRFEWAMQWENVLDGSSQEGGSPCWRLWDGVEWINTGIAQSLKPNTWHTFTLRGDIRGGQVHYVSFACDKLNQSLGYSFSPAAPLGSPRLNVALQLDGNSAQDPYSCVFDDVNLKWWRSSPW